MKRCCRSEVIVPLKSCLVAVLSDCRTGVPGPLADRVIEEWKDDHGLADRELMSLTSFSVIVFHHILYEVHHNVPRGIERINSCVAFMC